MGIVSPIANPEPMHSAIVFIEDLINGAFADARRVCVCDPMRLITLHRARVEQKSRTALSARLQIVLNAAVSVGWLGSSVGRAED